MPSNGRASPGSSTMGDRVPSKSSSTPDRRGSSISGTTASGATPGTAPTYLRSYDRRMPRMHGLRAVAALLGLAALIGCEPGTVEIRFAPNAGATTTYRYTITADVTRELAGVAPVTTRRTTTIEATQRVVAIEGGAAR